MDAIKLMKEFAKSQGINVNEVDKFMSQFNSPKTLNDVIDLPYDLQSHINYVTSLEEPLRSFIMDEWYDGDRYKTLSAERIIEFLCDRMYRLIENDNDDNWIDIWDANIQTLKAKDENSLERLDYLKSVAQHIIDIKFGSVLIDW